MKTTLTKKQQIALLKKISQELSYCLDNISWTKYYTNYLKENIKEERDHLKFKPEGTKHGLTAYEGGLLFSVKQIIEYLEGEKPPNIKNYLFMRKTLFTAYSLVSQYSDKIKEALKDLDYSEVLQMDYCYLVQHDGKGNKLY